MKKYTVNDFEDGFKLIKLGCLSLLDTLNEKKNININIDYDMLLYILNRYLPDYDSVTISDHYTVFTSPTSAFDVLKKDTYCNIELVK